MYILLLHGIHLPTCRGFHCLYSYTQLMSLAYKRILYEYEHASSNPLILVRLALDMTRHGTLRRQILKSFHLQHTSTTYSTIVHHFYGT
jgi:hypothetical protein